MTIQQLEHEVALARERATAIESNLKDHKKRLGELEGRLYQARYDAGICMRDGCGRKRMEVCGLCTKHYASGAPG